MDTSITVVTTQQYIPIAAQVLHRILPVLYTGMDTGYEPAREPKEPDSNESLLRLSRWTMSATPCGKDSSTPRSATPCGIPGLQPSPDMLRVLGAPAKNPLGDITNTPQAVPSTGKKRKVKSEDTKVCQSLR